MHAVVVPEAAVIDNIPSRAGTDHIGVRAIAADQGIRAKPAVQRVVAAEAPDLIGAICRGGGQDHVLDRIEGPDRAIVELDLVDAAVIKGIADGNPVAGGEEVHHQRVGIAERTTDTHVIRIHPYHLQGVAGPRFDDQVVAVARAPDVMVAATLADQGVIAGQALQRFRATRPGDEVIAFGTNRRDRGGQRGAIPCGAIAEFDGFHPRPGIG